MFPGSNDRKPNGHFRKTSMIQVVIDKVVSARFESVNYEFRLRKAIAVNVSSLLYIVKVSETLMEHDKFRKSVAQVVKTEASRVMPASSNPEEQIKRFARAGGNMVFDHSSPSSESLPAEISNDRNKKKAYSIKKSVEEERQRTNMENLYRRTT